MKKCLIAMLFAGTILVSNATIRYTFLYDDISTGDRLYDLDLDGDNDFTFIWDGSHYKANCTKPTSYIASDSMPFDTYSPKVYTEGSGLGTHWWHSDDFFLDAFENNSKYIAVKFNSGSNTFYGWIHLYDYAGTLHIGGYAYEDEAGQPITPGDKGTTGIATINAQDFGLSQTAPRTIAFSDCAWYDKVRVWNSAGQQLVEIKQPIAHRNYFLGLQEQILVITFYREEKLLLSKKYFIR
jgi:hypothetical protein